MHKYNKLELITTIQRSLQLITEETLHVKNNRLFLLSFNGLKAGVKFKILLKYINNSHRKELQLHFVEIRRGCYLEIALETVE